MKRSWIFFLTTLVASFVGVMMPQAADMTAWIPTVSMVVQLFYCFLETFEPSTPLPLASLRQLPGFLLFRMFVMPLLVWAVIRIVMPDFALGALLVAGASIGVMGPFFAYMCGAESFFVIGGLIVSSLMLPVSIPLVSAIALSFDGRSVEGLVRTCGGSAIFLACTMLIPLVASKVLWKVKAGAAVWLQQRRFGITLVWIAAGNFAIFSRFSGALLGNLFVMLEALLTALLVTAILLSVGLGAARHLPLARALSRLIGISCVNCGLMVIVAAEFFDLKEVMVCAMHTLPLMGMGIPYEYCRRWMIRHGRS